MGETPVVTGETPVLLQREGGHSLAEVVVAVALLGFMLISLYAGFSSGFAVLRVARENLRATQILAERMEVIRLIRFDDVAEGFVPGKFSAPFYATDIGTQSTGGFDYTGDVRIVKSPILENYAQDVKMIQVDLTWTSGKVTRTRQMTTFVSRYGLQNYRY
jgi:hypothetical protein